VGRVETVSRIDVRAFGAVGDGVNNCGRAIQAACDHVAASAADRGASVFFPPGVYVIENGFEVVVPTGLTLEGTGDDAVLQIGTAAPILPHTAFRVQDGKSITFVNLRFRGPVVAFATILAVEKEGPTGTLSFSHVTAENPTNAAALVAVGCRFALLDCAEIGVDLAPQATIPATLAHAGDGLWTGNEQPRQIKGTVNPSVGAGVAAPEGAIYQQYVAGAGELWVKTGAADTAWTAASGGGGGVASVTAGAGLVNSGTALNPILDVVANADGSITVNPNDVQVGVLATDVQHGVRGGGTQHAVAIPLGLAGFLSGVDKAKLDTIAPGAAVASVTAGAGLVNSGTATNPILDVVANADGSITVAADDVKVGVLATDVQHGVRGGGTQHAVATVAVNGFMSAADKTKLDGIAPGANTLQSAIFTANGNWVAPAGVTKVWLAGRPGSGGGGGGGGGGGFTGATGGGGAGGRGGGAGGAAAVVETAEVDVVPATNYAITIGAAGAGGAGGAGGAAGVNGNSGAAGTNGAKTLFDTLVAFGRLDPAIGASGGTPGGGGLPGTAIAGGASGGGGTAGSSYGLDALTGATSGVGGSGGGPTGTAGNPGSASTALASPLWGARVPAAGGTAGGAGGAGSGGVSGGGGGGSAGGSSGGTGTEYPVDGQPTPSGGAPGSGGVGGAANSAGAGANGGLGAVGSAGLNGRGGGPGGGGGGGGSGLTLGGSGSIGAAGGAGSAGLLIVYWYG
jgi:hypothetical protein